MNGNKGFTLIELLVCIAIVGILTSVVLASVNSAREKSREHKGLYGTSETCAVKINDKCVD